MMTLEYEEHRMIRETNFKNEDESMCGLAERCFIETLSHLPDLSDPPGFVDVGSVQGWDSCRGYDPLTGWT